MYMHAYNTLAVMVHARSGTDQVCGFWPRCHPVALSEIAKAKRRQMKKQPVQKRKDSSTLNAFSIHATTPISGNGIRTAAQG